MNIRVRPSSFHGSIKAPPSKSAAHRAAICAALSFSEDESKEILLHPIDPTKDMLATIGAATALGASCSLNSGELRINGIAKAPNNAIINCQESGSTLRFFVPIAAALGVNASFLGYGRLPERPMEELIQTLKLHGIAFSRNPNASNEIFNCSGRLKPGVFELPGNKSSQYVTGLLFALPLLDGDSEIVLTSQLESQSYVDMTIESLIRSDIVTEKTPVGYKVSGNQRYRMQSQKIEGDYSSAAFWFAAGAIGGDITVTGLRPDSKQGDRRILEILAESGSVVIYGENSVTVKRGKLRGFDADMSQIPDLTPILAVVAAFSEGKSRLYNAGRLRLKESDRITTIAAGLRELGADVTELRDELIIKPSRRFPRGGSIDSAGDHRIAMSMSIAASFCSSPSVISGCECVDKSYPDFYKDFIGVGGIYDVL